MPVKDTEHRKELRQFVKQLDSQKRLKNQATCSLYSGAKFKGRQKSGSNSYEVTVDIQVCHLMICIYFFRI